MKHKKEFLYKGAHAMIELQTYHLQSFYKTWQIAKAKNIRLPQTDDPDYKSFDFLLHHVLRASRNYLKWICRSLNLADPQVCEPPDLVTIEKQASSYIEHVHEQWNLPLREIEEYIFFDRTYISNWGVEYCIDSMMEHAVMHPIRHEYQLRELLKAVE